MSRYMPRMEAFTKPFHRRASNHKITISSLQVLAGPNVKTIILISIVYVIDSCGVILGHQEHLDEFDQILDPLQIIHIQSGRILRREDVREIDHIYPNPILFLFRRAGQFVQKIIVILFHFNDVVVEVVHVRMGATQSAHPEVRTTGSASVQRSILFHRVVLVAQADASFNKMHPLRRSISARFDAVRDRVAGRVEQARVGRVTVRRRVRFRWASGILVTQTLIMAQPFRVVCHQQGTRIKAEQPLRTKEQ